ncbi:hypothetical protein C0989_005168 [Termitomyces sp. Mn162]|nr:hypothetical protein C0989_005168 [Termitomyces sp. Mn162]
MGFDDGIDNTTSQPSPTINRVTITDAITTIDSGTPIMMTISSTVTQSQPSSSFSGTISSTPRSSPNSSPSVTIITSEILGTLQTTGMLQTTGTVLATSSLSNSTSGSASTNTANDITAHKPPTGAIAGGVVGGAVLILILNLFFVIWRRKRRAYMDLPTTIQEPKPSHLVLTPFTASSPADPTIETRTTEGVPFTSVRNQQDVLKMHDPQHHHSPSSSATPAEILRAHHQRTIDEQINEVKRELDGLGSSASGPSRSGGSDVTEILQQNQAMKAEIERLQAQLNSDLALGLIDGAPPEYSTHATDIHRLSSRAAPVAVS